MKRRPSLLALSALLLCTLQQSSPSSLSSSSSSSVVRGRNNVGLKQTGIPSRDANHSHESRPSPKLQGATEHLDRLFFNTSRDNISTVMPGGSGSWNPKGEVDKEEGISPECAYRVIEGGIGGQLCFRHALSGYKCHKGDCRTVVSVGNLVANILINGSVLLQWAQQGESTPDEWASKAKETSASQTNMTNEANVQSDSVFGGRRHRRGGFELSCWWNGSYTQFECAGVHLGPGCKDFLLSELHENIPYRLCLRSLERRREAEHRDCVEFTLPPSGMQDIVIAMTTVGGAICVMLVIICLLVAYITENIMSPTTQHTYSYRTHSRH